MSKIIKENPLLVYGLGLCVALLSSTNLDVALFIGLMVLIVSILSTFIISVFNKFIPNELRIVVILIITSTLVIVIDMLANVIAPAYHTLSSSIINLIIVNGLVLYNIEKNSISNSIYSSMSYIVALLIIAVIRQILSTGSISLSNPVTSDLLFSLSILPNEFTISLFKGSVGAFLILGLLMGLFKKGDEK